MTDPAAQAETLSYEQARDELAVIVQRLESGAASLEESLALWERGEQLAAICQAWLDGAKAKVDAAKAKVDAARANDPALAEET
jgi:exodeoxyribonuclease VII small subunit